MKTLPFTALMLTMLSGCSLFQVNTNLDKENFTEYFKPSSVAVMDKAQLLDADATPVGTVEGESCQSDTTQPVPNITDAQADARQDQEPKHAVKCDGNQHGAKGADQSFEHVGRRL